MGPLKCDQTMRLIILIYMTQLIRFYILCHFLIYYRIVDSKPHSRMWYRIGAVRNMTGGRKTAPASKMNEKLKEVIVYILPLLFPAEFINNNCCQKLTQCQNLYV